MWYATRTRIYSRIAVFAAFGMTLLLTTCLDTGRPGKTRPNIILIMADDLGYGDLGVYGQQRIRTPRLDQIAEEGLVFSQFYAGSTVCAPSRSVLMTGLHTGHTFIRGNGKNNIPPEVITVAEILKDAGYITGAFGKWGLGHEGSTGIPTKQGFDTFYGYLDQQHAHGYYPSYLIKDSERVMLENVVPDENQFGFGRATIREQYSHDLIVEEALAFIDRFRNESFFLYLPFTIPHAELLVPKPALGPYLNEEGNSIFSERPFPGNHYAPQSMPRATYAAMVSLLDRDIGRILDRIGVHDLDRNTIVFFTSDNGPHSAGGNDPAFFDSNGPLRGIKRDLYEGGIRVPMIVWGPGLVPADRQSEHVWAMWDFLATAADLVGISPPPGLDGISALPAIQNHERDQEKHEYLYWEFYERETAQAVRLDQWKGIRIPMFEGPIELYDLENDPGETIDLSIQYPDIVKEIETIMSQAHSPSPIWN